MIIRNRNPDGTIEEVEITIEELLAERRRQNRRPMGDEKDFEPIEEIKSKLRRGCCDRPR